MIKASLKELLEKKFRITNILKELITVKLKVRNGETFTFQDIDKDIGVIWNFQERVKIFLEEIGKVSQINMELERAISDRRYNGFLITQKRIIGKLDNPDLQSGIVCQKVIEKQQAGAIEFKPYRIAAALLESMEREIEYIEHNIEINKALVLQELKEILDKIPIIKKVADSAIGNIYELSDEGLREFIRQHGIIDDYDAKILENEYEKIKFFFSPRTLRPYVMRLDGAEWDKIENQLEVYQRLKKAGVVLPRLINDNGMLESQRYLLVEFIAKSRRLDDFLVHNRDKINVVIEEFIPIVKKITNEGILLDPEGSNFMVKEAYGSRTIYVTDIGLEIYNPKKHNNDEFRIRIGRLPDLITNNTLFQNAMKSFSTL